MQPYANRAATNDTSFQSSDKPASSSYKYSAARSLRGHKGGAGCHTGQQPGQQEEQTEGQKQGYNKLNTYIYIDAVNSIPCLYRRWCTKTRVRAVFSGMRAHMVASGGVLWLYAILARQRLLVAAAPSFRASTNAAKDPM
jgi:hypothetical protein